MRGVIFSILFEIALQIILVSTLIKGYWTIAGRQYRVLPGLARD